MGTMYRARRSYKRSKTGSEAYSKPDPYSANQVHAELAEGDIVEITKGYSIYHIAPLIEEIEVTLEKVNSLLEKLKNKKY